MIKLVLDVKVEGMDIGHLTEVELSDIPFLASYPAFSNPIKSLTITTKSRYETLEHMLWYAGELVEPLPLRKFESIELYIVEGKYTLGGVDHLIAVVSDAVLENGIMPGYYYRPFFFRTNDPSYTDTVKKDLDTLRNAET